MKTTNYLILPVMAAMLSLSACKNKETQAVEPTNTRMEKVMAEHDEIMPYMSEIGQLIRQLEENADGIQTEALREKLINDLKSANESMMNWMMEFGDDFDSEEVLDGKPLNEEKTARLIEYEQSIGEMRKDMEEAINNARDYLQEQE